MFSLSSIIKKIKIIFNNDDGNIKVKSAYVDKNNPDKYEAVGLTGMFKHLNTTKLTGELIYKKCVYQYTFTRYEGYVGNFASSPMYDFVQKIVPSFSSGDDVYNFAFDLHDWLYSVKGELTRVDKDMTRLKSFTREECDAFMRGVMRESDTIKKESFARIRAAIADKSVDVGADGPEHWGNDSENSKGKATLVLKLVDALK